MKHCWNGTERENRSIRIKVSLFSPHISQGLICNRTPDSAVTDQRLTAWTMTRPNNIYHIKTSIILQFVPHREQVCFLHDATAPNVPGPAHHRGFTFTLRHTTLIRTTLDGWSARRTYLYLTTHNTHKRQASMHPAGFEQPTVPAGERPQTQAIDPRPTGIGERVCCHYKFKNLLQLFTEMIGKYFEKHFKHVIRYAVKFSVSKG